MAVLFVLNDETAATTVQSDIAAIEELSSLETQADKLISDLAMFNHTMELNNHGIRLAETLKDILHAVIPAMTAAVEPVHSFVSGMGQVREEIGNSSFRSW